MYTQNTVLSSLLAIGVQLYMYMYLPRDLLQHHAWFLHSGSDFLKLLRHTA